MSPWADYQFIQDVDERPKPLVIASAHLTGWETVIFELADEAHYVAALNELRAAIEEAERMVDEWEL
jgi:hypothetical protein